MTSDIFNRLRDEIEIIVKQDGIKGHKPHPDYPMESTEDVIERAVLQIYFDVAEFYDWYFKPTDLRFDHAEPVATGSDSLKVAIQAVVEDNLDAMLEADEIDQATLDALDKDMVTDKLVGYVENWQYWFWARKELEDLEAILDWGIQDAELDEDYEGDYLPEAPQEKKEALSILSTSLEFDDAQDLLNLEMLEEFHE